jgi:hypothetical protein
VQRTPDIGPLGAGGGDNLGPATRRDPKETVVAVRLQEARNRSRPVSSGIACCNLHRSSSRERLCSYARRLSAKRNNYQRRNKPEKQDMLSLRDENNRAMTVVSKHVASDRVRHTRGRAYCAQEINPEPQTDKCTCPEC